MPKVELEILRTVTITREESIIVEVDVPAEELGEDGDLLGWVDQQMDTTVTEVSDSVLRAAIGEELWAVNDEDETYEYDDVTNFSE